MTPWHIDKFNRINCEESTLFFVFFFFFFYRSDIQELGN